MDADEGKIVCVGERLREGEPHEQRPDEARPRSDGEPIQIGEPKARFRQRRGNDVRNDANMIPTRKLRHDATVGRMHALLPMHGARHDLATAAKNRRGHLITRTLDPENEPVLGKRVSLRMRICHGAVVPPGRHTPPPILHKQRKREQNTIGRKPCESAGSPSDHALRRSIASCSALQSIQSSATGRASIRLSVICSPQLSHSP